MTHRINMTRALQRLARCGLLLAAGLAVAPGAQSAASLTHWVSSWMAAPDSPGPALPPQTMRQVLRVSLGGSAVRLRLSNAYGDRPLHIQSGSVALAAEGSDIVAGTAQAITVHGRRDFVLGVGDTVLTDALPLRVRSLQRLAVSLYLPEGSGASTIHSTGMANAVTQRDQDRTEAPRLRIDDQDDSRYFLTDLEVRVAASDAGAIVTVGDSTTDGVGSALDSDTRWPDQLAQRLQADPSLRHLAVANAGISGNRLIHDAHDPFLGQATLRRFDRDVLSKPGVRWVVLLQGINDITASRMFADPQQQVTAGQMIAAMQELVTRAHAQGVCVMGATMLPREGAQGARRHTPEGEAMRQQVNAWIREGKGFDAVVDFDAVLRDPDQPARQRSALNSGDFSHPNARGYGAMAQAIDTSVFRAPCGKTVATRGKAP